MKFASTTAAKRTCFVLSSTVGCPNGLHTLGMYHGLQQEAPGFYVPHRCTTRDCCCPHGVHVCVKGRQDADEAGEVGRTLLSVDNEVGLERTR